MSSTCFASLSHNGKVFRSTESDNAMCFVIPGELCSTDCKILREILNLIIALQQKTRYSVLQRVFFIKR